MALKKSELYSSVWASRDDLSGCMDAKIAELETKPAKAHQVKQGKMQKLASSKSKRNGERDASDKSFKIFK